MASKKTLNARNLTSLGAERLAELLIETSMGDAAAKRLLRLELAGVEGPAEVAREIRKRLTTISASRTYVDWDKIKVLASDLENQRRAIGDKVAPGEPVEALDLMWRFLGLAGSVFDRCDDSSGKVGGVFRRACEDLSALAAAAEPSTTELADRTFSALCDNDYAQYDGLVRNLAPALGVEGLTLLRQRVTDLSGAPTYKPSKGERVIVGLGSNGPLYADQIRGGSRTSMVRLALADIADALGDVDAYIGQHDERARSSPAIAARIAARLLAVGRAREALAAVELADSVPEGRLAGLIGRGALSNDDLETARVTALDVLGRGEEAQMARWAWFEQTLSARALRDHLKRLPDFDDVEAEEKAMIMAVAYADPHRALSFLAAWPALAPAAELTIRRATEIDGDRYEILTPTAEALSAKYPLAATLLLRAMIDYTLERARSSRYRHAARHLQECESLAASVADFGGFSHHDDYVAGLRAAHGRKTGFWGLLG